jgi:hypothetical protein
MKPDLVLKSLALQPECGQMKMSIVVKHAVTTTTPGCSVHVLMQIKHEGSDRTCCACP